MGTDEHVIQLDNTAPVASIHITSGTGDCGKFAVGDGMVGNFTATDLYFGSYSLDILPGSLPSGMLAPTSGTLNTPPAPGVWTLNTGSPLMKPCGYVIRVRAWDRAILNSQGVGHEAEASAGFCLEASTK